MEKKHTHSYLKGVDDFKRGHTSNPFPYGRDRRGWQKGWEQAKLEKETKEARNPK